MRKNKLPKISQHAAELMQRRRQRFYGFPMERKECCSITLPRPILPSAAPATITTRKTKEESTNVYITIKLLGEVTMTLHAPGGLICAVPVDLNFRTIQLLAHIGWKRDIPVKRDKLIENIWGHERTDEEETCKKQGWAFDDARKALRATIREAIKELNCEFGKILLDPKMDIFEHRSQLWWLSSHCRVTDLEKIESQHRVIIEAKKNGILFNMVPEHVKVACDKLIDAYTGDFLAGMIQHYPIDQVSWADNWMRVPITLYRDYYLDALWWAAEYDYQTGQRFVDEPSTSDTSSRWKQRECWGQAAELYKTYAMSACNNQYDLKIFFGLPYRGDSDRVKKSELALRNCVMLYGELGRSDLIDEAYYDYYDLMRNISNENWEPSGETLKEVLAARVQAAAYRSRNN